MEICYGSPRKLIPRPYQSVLCFCLWPHSLHSPCHSSASKHSDLFLSLLQKKTHSNLSFLDSVFSLPKHSSLNLFLVGSFFSTFWSQHKCWFLQDIRCPLMKYHHLRKVFLDHLLKMAACLSLLLFFQSTYHHQTCYVFYCLFIFITLF